MSMDHKKEHIRLKFGRNPYHQPFTCAFCRRAFEQGGFFIRLEHQEKVVDVPLCPKCFGEDNLYEGMIDLSKHSTSHPVGLA